MRINEDHFDEMQKQKRAKISSQSFHLLLYALLLDIFLAGKVEWIEYPANILLIVVAICGVHMTRLILAGAYLPPRESPTKLITWKVIVFAAAFVLAMLLVRYAGFEAPAESSESSLTSIILVVTSLASLAAAGIAAISRRLMRRKGGDDD